MAPVVHVTRNGERELTMMRWGMPPPANLGTRPVTNVRNLNSPYRRGWRKPAMPVLLTTPEECDDWLDGSIEKAVAIRRPLPAELLHIVATGPRKDKVGMIAA